MIKKVIIRLYAAFLKTKWHMKKEGAKLLARSFLRDYIGHAAPFSKVSKSHRLGYTWMDWHIIGLNEHVAREYMSTAEYYAHHPYNNAFSHWIDDKLTLKYLCAGTILDQYMPAYYYQIDTKGHLLALPDCEEENSGDFHVLVRLLRKKGTLAVKLASGSLGVGFYKAQFDGTDYWLNDEKMSEEDLLSKFSSLRGYIITEYLRPHPTLAVYSPGTANCIRYLIGRVDGEMKMLKGYIRFGTKRSGFVENYNSGGLLCFLDEAGRFFQGNVMDQYTGENRVISTHPELGVELAGVIPCWDRIVEAGERFGKVFPQLDYLGMDFVVTQDGAVKVLEINSLTSLDGIELDKSVFNAPAKAFFSQYVRR